MSETSGLPSNSSLDTTIFVLPLPEEAAGALDLPEPPLLRQGADQGRRARIKRYFWEPVIRPLSFRPEISHDFVIQDPIAPERLDQLESWAGLFQEPRYVEQPLAVQEGLEQKSPQFTLRNLHRMEKDAWPDDLWWSWKTLRKLPHELGLDEVRKMHLVPRPSFHEEWLLEYMKECIKKRRELLHELAWCELRFRWGRPREDPAKEPEQE